MAQRRGAAIEPARPAGGFAPQRAAAADRPNTFRKARLVIIGAYVVCL